MDGVMMCDDVVCERIYIVVRANDDDEDDGGMSGGVSGEGGVMWVWEVVVLCGGGVSGVGVVRGVEGVEVRCGVGRDDGRDGVRDV